MTLRQQYTFLTSVAPHLDVFALARLAGHTSIRTTQQYIHPAGKTLEDGLARLGGLKIGHSQETLNVRFVAVTRVVVRSLRLLATQ